MNSEIQTNTENTVENTVKNTDSLHESKTEKIKKPRKPLSEESKEKRRITLQKARQAKLEKSKGLAPPKVEPVTATSSVVKKLETIPEASVLQEPKKDKKKTEADKIMKKVEKELKIESLIEEKLGALFQEKEANKLRKLKDEKQRFIKNLF